MLKKNASIILLLIVFTTLNLFSQNRNNNVERFTISNGLSQNTINCVMQDSRGFLWIGTQDGLNKYDGHSFKIYRHDPVDNHSISSNFIRNIYETKDSSIWVVTQDGLNKYNFENNTFKSYFINTAEINSSISNDIYSIIEDSSGILWLKTEKGLNKFNPKTKQLSYFKHFYDPFSYSSRYNNFPITQDKQGKLWMAGKDGLIMFDSNVEQFSLFKVSEYDSEINEIFTIHIGKNNKIWTGTKKGLFIFDISSHKFSKIKIDSENKDIKVIFEDKDGIIWAGTNNGITTYDINSKTLKYCDLYDASFQNITIGRVSSFMQDNSKILWVGTENGLIKIDRKHKKFKAIIKGDEIGKELSNYRTYSICEDEINGKILLGTRKFGLNVFNPKTGKNKIFNNKNSNLLSNDIHSIQKDRKERILIGTNNGVYVYNSNKNTFKRFEKFFNIRIDKRFKNNRVSNIIQDKNMGYWIATYNGLFLFDGQKMNIFTTKSRLARRFNSNELTQVIERKNGEIWLATLKGLSKLISPTKGFENYTITNSNISNNAILSLCETKDGTLWIGTETGLNRYNEKTNDFDFYTSQKNGFSNDYIYSIIEDNNQELWLSTNKGIIKFNPKNKKVKNFTLKDGLQGYEYNIGANYKNKNGIIYFGGVNGINIINPDSVVYFKYAPQPHITNFIKFNKGNEEAIYTGNLKHITLKYNERDFTIFFSTPEYTHPSQNKYKYRIKELDTEWKNLGNSNKVRFTRMPSGNYTFEVIASNSDDEWSKKSSQLKITILSPWWKTYKAYFSYVFLLVIIIVLIVIRYSKKMRMNNLKLKQEKLVSKKIIKQREQLQLKNKSISDSINYAKRIIDAMIPSVKQFTKLLPESFIYFKPKDIVSGDFYWIRKRKDKIFIAAADCTGHGVPGAFMSIVGLDLLRNIVSAGTESPSEILNELNEQVIQIFNQDLDNPDKVKDGMDIAVCCIDKKNKKLDYAGAINPLYIFKKEKLIEVKGNRFAIGHSEHHEEIKFTNHTIELEKDDVIYMFSDGYVDQFGGESNKKFKYRRFRHLLLNIHNNSFSSQKDKLDEVLKNWKNDNEQVDDILILGIKPLAK